MGNMYERLKSLCEEKGVSAYKMCKDTGMQPSIMTDLKMGRKHTLSAKSMAKVAKYFGVSMNYIAGDSDDRNEDSESISPFVVQSGFIGEVNAPSNGALSVTAEEMSDLAEVWNVLKDRPEAKMLFKSSKSATAEQLIETAKYLDYLKSKG